MAGPANGVIMKRHEVVEFLKNIKPFNSLGNDVLEKLSAIVSVKMFKTNTYIFKQGEPSLEALFIMVSGLLEITVTSDRGVESVVSVRKAGDFFSEAVVLSGQPYPVSARVREDLLCIKIHRRDLETLIYNHPSFLSYFNEFLAERMRLLYDRILAEQGIHSAGCVDMPLFRKKVSEIMTTSVVTCRADDQVALAAKPMIKNGIGASVVVDAGNKPIGIVTMKSIVENLITESRYSIDNCTADQIMDTDLEVVASDAFTGHALVMLTRQKSNYLLVMERDNLVGILTAIDFIKSGNIGHLTLLQDIDGSHTIEDLARVSDEIDNVLNVLLAEGAKIPDILEVMSEIHERLIRAVICNAERQMVEKGFGPPPVDYCWINMGSDARHEQTLRTDQDNAIIYEDPDTDDKERVEAYFGVLADTVVHGLEQCGFALCTGGVMATNPKWRRSLSQWKDYVDQWSTTFNPEETMDMTILLDFRSVWGNQALARALWDKIFQVFEDPEKINHMLTALHMQFAIPINFLGHLRTEKKGPHKNQLNLKKGGLVHIINAARIFAINNRITETSTLGRLRQLTEMGVISEKRSDVLKTAFETLVMFKLRTNLQKMSQNQKRDHYMDPSALNNREIVLLKDALYSASQMQKLTNSRFTQASLKFFS